MLVVSQKAYIFEEMSLVASQLPLTREPRKECGARDSITFARVFRAELLVRCVTEKWKVHSKQDKSGAVLSGSALILRHFL